MSTPSKPLGHKAYGSIAHLPGSRMGPADHHCHKGQATIATEKARDKHDLIVVTEKLDGSCTAVVKVDGQILALGRAGWPAQSSPYEQHQLFAAWVRERESLFQAALNEGERMVGEWLAQAHGTRYKLPDGEPWIPFDLMRGPDRLSHLEARARAALCGLGGPQVLHIGGPCPLEKALDLLGQNGWHGALDPVEGVVYRVERKGKFDFLAKWVRPNKLDGSLLPEQSGQPAIWNWRPK